jgi:transposase-like protein
VEVISPGGWLYCRCWLSSREVEARRVVRGLIVTDETIRKDFMAYAGVQRPEQFREITRAHVIAWRQELAAVPYPIPSCLLI